jgi:hypothetical protein
MDIDLLEKIKISLIKNGALFNIDIYLIEDYITFDEGEQFLFCVSSMESFYLFLVLSEQIGFISNKDKMKLFKSAYSCSDNIFYQCTLYDNNFDIRNLFIDNQKCRRYLMTSYEKKVYRSLPDQITIYRGMSSVEIDSGNYGISWTLDKKIAQFFTNYYRNGLKDGLVVEKSVLKKDIIAYFSDRKEKEIIYLQESK